MRLYYTVDVDRDVNIQLPGAIAAGSIDRGAGTAPRFASSGRGLELILDMLDDLGIRGTFFFEGRTAEEIDPSRAEGHSIGIHGYDHEDLTALEQDALEHVIERSFEAVRDRVGRPTCFRAPYMTADSRVLSTVKSITGISVDSSFYTDADASGSPYQRDGMTEVPVTRSRDRNGNIIAAYLWPMHEGKRMPEDYISMARAVGGDIVIADHSWHMVETRASGPMGEGWERDNICKVREVLEGLMDAGFVASAFDVIKNHVS